MIFNIQENTSNIKYVPQQAEHLLSSLQDLITSDMSKKEITVDIEREQSFPEIVTTHLELLKQVLTNVASSLTKRASNTSLVLNVSGYQTSVGIEAILDLTCEVPSLSEED